MGAYRIGVGRAHQLMGALVQHHAATLRELGAWRLPPNQELVASLHSLAQLRVLHTNWHLHTDEEYVLVWLTQGSLRMRLEELSVSNLPAGNLSEPAWGSGSFTLPRVHTLTCVPLEAQRLPTAHSAAGHCDGPPQVCTGVALLSCFPALRRLHGALVKVHLNQGTHYHAEWQDLLACLPQLQQLHGDWGPAILVDRSALPPHPAGLLPGALHGASHASIIFHGRDAGGNVPMWVPVGLGVGMRRKDHAPPHPAVPLLAALFDSLSGIRLLNMRISSAADAQAFLHRLLPALARLPATLQAVAFWKDPAVGLAAEEEAFLRRVEAAAPPSLQRMHLHGFSQCRGVPCPWQAEVL